MHTPLAETLRQHLKPASHEMRAYTARICSASQLALGHDTVVIHGGNRIICT